MSLDTLRSQLASLKQKEASLLKDRAKHEGAAATARTKKQGKLRDASKTKSDATKQSNLRMAESYEKTELSETKKAADIAAKLASNAADQRRKLEAISSAEKQEDRRRTTRESTRRREELAHVKAVARASAAVVRYVHVPAPRPEKLRILYLTTNPDPDGDWLRTDAEIRAVKNILRGSLHRELVEVEHKSAATIEDMLDGINDIRPHVIHFSGHGGKGALVFDNGSAEAPDGKNTSFELLAKFLGSTAVPPTLLVLNACDTLVGADVLLPVVPVIIAMSDEVDDAAATVFAGGFYAAIASAQPVTKAFEQGKARMEAAGFVDDALLPTLIARDDLDPNTLVLVTTQTDGEGY